MEPEIVINGIVYFVLSAEELQQYFGMTIDTEYGSMYGGPETGAYTDGVIEVPESITVEGQTVPVVGFDGGGLNGFDVVSVSEVILPSTILCLLGGFYGFTNLQKVTCYAESAPLLSSEIFGDQPGTDFEGTPSTKELYIPSGSDYSTWTNDTTWGGC